MDYHNYTTEPKFFVLENPDFSESSVVTEFWDLEDSKHGPAPTCQSCGKFLSSLEWLPPYKVIIESWGKSFGDVVFGPAKTLLVSENFKSKWEKSNLTGLKGFHPVEVVKVISRGKKIKPPRPNYFMVEPIRSKTIIDDVKSGFEREEGPVCSKCHLGGLIKKVQKIVLKNKTWNGEDIFYAQGLSGTILTSMAFKEFCETHKISNAVLIPAEEYSFEFDL